MMKRMFGYSDMVKWVRKAEMLRKKTPLVSEKQVVTRLLSVKCRSAKAYMVATWGGERIETIKRWNNISFHMNFLTMADIP